MNREHTPIPWEVNGSLIVKDCYGKVIADTDVSINHPPKRYVEISEAKANAAFIVHAVNSHDELLRGVKGALRFIEGYYYNGETPEEVESHPSVKTLRGIIKKAEGE